MTRRTLAVALALLVVAPLAPRAQTARPPRHTHQHGAATPPAAPDDAATSEPASRQITMEELHRLGGTPRGWKFSLPEGDAARGRQVFVDAGCFKCHAINDPGLPDAGAEKRPGPDLTDMGGHHPAEYFAESILSPNAVIVTGPGFTGTDGLSIMPSYADSLSVEQLLDVVAFIKGQPGESGHHHADGARETLAGDYRVRLASAPVTDAAGKTVPGDRLMVFVTDRTTGEPVPYLPVQIRLHAPGKAARVVRLAPTMGAEPFHYAGTVRVPDDVETIDVAIGATSMRVTGAPATRYRKPVTATFEWP
jgi:mono/diheme cytochrome c family protein